MMQHTIANTVSVTGIGLHSGREVKLTLNPSAVDTGINFIRSDIHNSPKVPADAFLINDTLMSSNLQKGEVKIGTIEHLMSALAGLGVDNLLVEVSDSEIPIMDGSAAAYVELIIHAGLQAQEAPKKFLEILKTVRVSQADKWAEITPYKGYRLSFEIDFDHPAIVGNTQKYEVEFSSKNFITQIAKARTFGFMKDIQALRENNLALGGSLDNAIVLDDNSIMNKTGLRYNDEFVRHKILDAVGDLYLAQYPLLGHFRAYKSGHNLNNELVRKIYSDKTNYKIVTKYDKDEPLIDYEI